MNCWHVSKLTCVVQRLLKQQQKKKVLTQASRRFPIGELIIVPDAFVAKNVEMKSNSHTREFELLFHLATHMGQVMTREHLLETVWGYDYFGDVRTVDVTIRRLREKIEDTPSRPEYILTRRGVGYYMKNYDWYWLKHHKL